jgi:hypothetical protein
MPSVHCAGPVPAGISVLFLSLACGSAVRTQDSGLSPLIPADMKATGTGGPALILYRVVDTDNTMSTGTANEQ